MISNLYLLLTRNRNAFNRIISVLDFQNYVTIKMLKNCNIQLLEKGVQHL